MSDKGTFDDLVWQPEVQAEPAVKPAAEALTDDETPEAQVAYRVIQRRLEGSDRPVGPDELAVIRNHKQHSRRTDRRVDVTEVPVVVPTAEQVAEYRTAATSYLRGAADAIEQITDAITPAGHAAAVRARSMLDVVINYQQMAMGRETRMRATEWQPDQHEWTAPSGVQVKSEPARPEPNIADSPWTHWIWSYSSWLTWILVDHGIKWPRRFLAKRGWWGEPK